MLIRWALIFSVVLPSLAASVGRTSSSGTKCKCLAGQPCFPSQTVLNTFSQSLSQPLVSGIRPLGAVCYPNSTEYSSAACASVKQLQEDVFYRVSQFNAAVYENVESILTDNSTVGCPFDPVAGGTCQQGRVPSYAVNVTTVGDIQKTIRFATQHNLHLVVRNTGHEFLGRGLGVGSIELFTHHLKNITFFDAFKPTGAPASVVGEPAVTLAAGVEWGEIYLAADQHNRTIPGGFSPGGSVGASGGWVLGGGHSVLSPFYGLGVDNVLQFTVVLPNASHITANKYQHQDLFWALRGGGGPSFGVVTSTTYKTHESLPYTAVFYTATADSDASWRSLLELWMQHHNDVADAGWSGVWPFIGKSLSLTFFAQGTPPIKPTANATMESFFAESRKISGVNVSLAISVPYPSFQAWNEDNLIDSSKGYGFNFTAGSGAHDPKIALSSWLLPRELTAPGNSSKLIDAMVNLAVCVPFLVGGGAVSAVDPDETAVTPAWRTAISDLTILPVWGSGSDAVRDLHEQYALTFQQIQPFRELAPIPAGGQYINEPDNLEVDWQGAYWGRHYPRLQAIKKAIDPYDLFIVVKGVNSENWDDQQVCKTV